jgi:hypothetical protein
VGVDVDSFIVEVCEGVNAGVIAVRNRAVGGKDVGVILVPFWKVGECHEAQGVLGLGVAIGAIIAILGGRILNLRRQP